MTWPQKQMCQHFQGIKVSDYVQNIETRLYLLNSQLLLVLQIKVGFSFPPADRRRWQPVLSLLVFVLDGLFGALWSGLHFIMD